MFIMVFQAAEVIIIANFICAICFSIPIKLEFPNWFGFLVLIRYNYNNCAVSGGHVSLIQGSYEYYHYLQDGFDDSVTHLSQVTIS